MTTPEASEKSVSEASGVAHVGAFFVAGTIAVVTGVSVLIGGSAVNPGASQGKARPKVGSEVPVTAMQQGQGLANTSPELAVDPRARQFVAAAHRVDAPRFGCGLHVSSSGGQGWRPVNPVPELPEGAKTCYAPQVAFGPHGRLHYLFAGLHGRGNEPMGVFLASSDDRGQSFTAPQQVLGERNFSVRMSLDRRRGERGRMYLTWLHATSDPPLGAMPPAPNPIKFAASPDGGQTWTEPIQVNPEGDRRAAAPAMRVAPDGTVYVAYYDLKQDQRDYKGLAGPVYEGTWSLVLAHSTDGGDTFTSTVVDDAVRPVERVMLIFTMAPPALAAGPDERVCVGWPQAHEGHGDTLARCSPDRGETWGERERLNQDPGDSSAIHVLPQLAFAPNGRLDAAFLARNPTSDLQHTYYTASQDGGRSFAEPVRLTSQASHAGIGQRYVGPAAEGKVEFGSRLGLLARSHHAVAMWPDTRNSRVMTTGQDLFAARVSHPPSHATRPVAALAGAGLVVAGLAAGGVGLARRRPRRAAVGAKQAGRTAEVRDAGHSGDPAGRGGTGVSQPKSKRWWARHLGVAAASAVALALVAALGWRVAAEPPPQLPADPTQVTVSLNEEGLDYTTEEAIPAGRVVFRVANHGEHDHRVALLPMEEGAAPIGEQLTDAQAQPVAPFAGVAPLEPGESTAFAVDLRPDQRYALVDFSSDPEDAEGRSYAEQGWHAEFGTTGARSSPGATAGER